MWQLPSPVRERVKTLHTSSRRPRRCRPHCTLLEERCLLSVTLTPSGAPAALVGAPVTWTASASGDGTSPVYQFSVAPSGGAYQMVQDFSPRNSFTWNPLQEGTYQIQVVVKSSYSVTTGDTTSASYTAKSRVFGTSPVISPTSNPLVALFSAPPSTASSMYVQFAQLGPNPSWQDTAPKMVVPGESTNFLVAGMLPNTTYLMRDVANLGTTSAPLAFTTGSLPSYLTFPTFAEPVGPAPGTDLTQDMILHMGLGSNIPSTVTTLATDLNGNIDWYYDPVVNNFSGGYATTLVPGGTVLILGNPSSGPGAESTLREVDLVGDTLHETNVNALNAELAALGDAQIQHLDHEALRLPNGDTAILATNSEVINLNGTPTTFLGDEVIVLNQNFQVVWDWNAFNFLSTSRLPTNPADISPGQVDWLHANSISLSPADGNLIVSLRSQDWVIKIDYANASGDGHVIWTLGQDGNFTLDNPGGVQSPWFSHQHDVTYIDDSTILVFDDGNTRRLTNPNADSRGQEYLINEQTMTATLVYNVDLGNYSGALGSAQQLPNGNYAFDSGALPNSGQSIEVLPDGTISYVQQINGINQYRSYFVSNLYGSLANILDPGFEDTLLGTGYSAFQYDPTGTAWTFSGSAGVSANGSGFTSGNPSAPQASQVAFLQKTGSISQAVDFTAAGTYQLGVSAAQRANYGTSNEEVGVEIDGTVVDTFTPSATKYATYTTPAFTVTSGNHTIAFVGIDPSGHDYTSLLDQISINNVAPAGFSDPGFENPSVGTGSYYAFQYDPAASTWSFSGTAGVAGNGSGFTNGNPAAPDGSQVAFLQKTGTISQVVNFPAASSYQINISAAQRGNYNTSIEVVDVVVDGTIVDTFTPAGTNFATYTTPAFNLTAGSHTISFVGVDPSGKDYTALLDQASVVYAPQTAFSDTGFESPSVATGTFQYNPTGTAWSYSSSSGVAANGSSFTVGNPTAPEGSQVGFLQKTSTISQVVNFATAGSYVVSVSAAQEATSSEEVQVLVDGTLVDTFTPASTSYATYTTASFNVPAGNHTISFVGVDPSGNDYTALLDEPSINVVSPTAPSDPSFENPTQGTGALAYQYDPTGTVWSYSGSAGVAGNGSNFTKGNSNAPQGAQVVFIQKTGTISQTLNIATAGSYVIGISATQRADFGTSNEEVDVLVDGTVVSTFTPASTNYSTYSTAPISVTAGAHTVSFVGVDPSGKDYTAFVDWIEVYQVG